MHAANNGLEVVNIECPGIEVAIPTDDIERVVIKNKLVETVVLFNEQAKVAHLVVGLELAGTAHVTFGIGSALLELPELIPIPLRPADVSSTFHDEELWMIPLHVELVAMQNAAMNDEVISLAKWQVAEDRLERSASL